MNADDIFNQIVEGADSLAMAKQMLVMFYVPDMSIPRDQICLAEKKLKRHFGQEAFNK